MSQQQQFDEAPPAPRGYIPSTNRVCAYTHITEKAHGKPLQACGRCKETLYIDRDSQLAHWPQHKRVCCAIENDPHAHILKKQSRSLHQVLKSFKIILPYPEISIKGRLFLYLFMELRRICAINAETDRRQFMMLRDVILECVSRPLKDLIDNREFTRLIWAIPGFANYFLSTDVLTSLAMIDHKKRNEPPPKMVLSQNLFEEGSIVPIQLQLPTPYYYAVLVLFIISSEHDEVYPNFSNSLVAATIRTQMEGWKCPYVRACVPVNDEVPQDLPESLKTTTRELLFQSSCTTSLNRRFPLGEGSPINRREIIPGLTVKDTLMLLLVDESLLLTDKQKALFDILLSLTWSYRDPRRGGQEPSPDHKYAWDAFSLEDRLDLLEYLNSRDMKKVKDKLNTIRNENGQALNQYLRLIFGDTSTILKLRALAVGRGSKAHSPQTLVMLHNLYNQLMEARDELSLSPREEVYAYLAVLGQYHEEEHPTEEALPQFPDELQLLVAEFLVKETFPFVQAENLEEAPDEFREEPI